MRHPTRGKPRRRATRPLDMATTRLAGLAFVLALALAVGCSSPQGPVTAWLTSCIFDSSMDAIDAQVVLTNGTTSDADLAAIVYWLTSVTPPGAFGNGNDGSLDPSVIGNDYVGGSEPAETTVPAGGSSTVPVDIPLGGSPRPPGLRCVVGAATDNGAPYAS